jgi:hypothetical protein
MFSYLLQESLYWPVYLFQAWKTVNKSLEKTINIKKGLLFFFAKVTIVKSIAASLQKHIVAIDG